MTVSPENKDAIESGSSTNESISEVAETVPRAYENLHNDPDFRKLHENLTEQVNEDAQVRSAMRGGKSHQYSEAWDRVFNREYFFALEHFARDNSERASGYRERWNEFTREHPEIASMNNAEWDRWGEQTP